MRRVPQPPRRSFPWGLHILALTAVALLAGCANGDFQEVRPTLVSDSIHDWLGPNVLAGQPISPSRYTLTDDERALRDLAYPLIEPPYDRHQWYSIAGEYGIINADHRPFDRAAYWNRLASTRYHSPAARYARLTDDIQNDTTRLPAFFENASRVLDIDGKRQKSLAYISQLAPAERQNALERIHENRAIVALVCRKLNDRVAGYRFALERLVIQTPATRAADVEHYLNYLQTRIAYYSSHPVSPWVEQQSLASIR